MFHKDYTSKVQDPESFEKLVLKTGRMRVRKLFEFIGGTIVIVAWPVGTVYLIFQMLGESYV